MLRKIAFSMLVSLGLGAAYADPVNVDETKSYQLTAIDSLGFECTPGAAPDGHNYPTDSAFGLGNIDTIFPDSTVTLVATDAAQFGTGDHCAEIKAAVEKLLPVTLSLHRTVQSRYDWNNGVCVEFLIEEVNTTLDAYALVGTRTMALQTVANSNCN